MATRVDHFIPLDILSARGGKAFPLTTTRDSTAEKLQKQKAAQEFAALLFLEVIKAMRATVPSGGLFESDSLSQDVYSTLADAEVARSLVKREGVGLSKYIERALDAHDRVLVPPASRSVLPPLETRVGPVSKEFSQPPQNSTAVSRLHTTTAADDTLTLPVVGRITSHFGLRRDPLGEGERQHKGIDIAAPAGTPVRAAAAGKVIFSGRAGGYGNVVAIDHGNGFTTRYAHNQTLLVSIGETVKVGQEIAQVGSTGRSTGPHLHFEVLREGQAVDPLAMGANFLSARKLASR